MDKETAPKLVLLKEFAYVTSNKVLREVDKALANKNVALISEIIEAAEALRNDLSLIAPEAAHLFDKGSMHEDSYVNPAPTEETGWNAFNEAFSNASLSHLKQVMSVGLEHPLDDFLHDAMHAARVIQQDLDVLESCSIFTSAPTLAVA